MDMTTDVDRLSGKGVPLEIDGHSFTARFTMGSLADVETQYGSLVDVGKLLLRLGDPENNTGPTAAPLYGTVAALMVFTLRHERIDGRPVTREWIDEHADPRRIVDYERIVFQALQLAMPGGGEQPDGDPTTPAPPAKRRRSRGERYSGSASPDAASAPPTSGTA